MQLRIGDALRPAIAERRRRFLEAMLCAALLGGASVVLLGLSGWFLTAAALAGLAGPAIAPGFNYMLPAAGIRLLAITRTGARYGERIAGHAGALRVSARLRALLFAAALRLPVSHALGLSSGEASAHLAEDVGMVEGVLVRRSVVWQLLASLLSAVALLWLAGWRPAVALVAMIAGLLALTMVGARPLAALGRDVRARSGRLKREVGVLSQAATEIRAYRLDAWAIERMGIHARALEEVQRRMTAALGRFDALMLAAIALAAPIAVMLSASRGAPVAALSALAAIMAVDGAAPWIRTRVSAGMVDAADERLDALLDGSATYRAAGEVPRQHAQIDHPPLSFESQGRVALCGPSGSGKTTIIEALLGLREMPGVTLTFDGLDVALHGTEAMRAALGWCPQDAALLNGTVRDNLRLAAPHANDADMWRALGEVCLADRIRRGGGLDGWIGEGGERLSGGERRRLALARACLAPARCLLLDEPTEGLDAETERAVVHNLAGHLRRTGKGLILISHRPLPLSLVDRRIDLGEITTCAFVTGDSRSAGSEPFGARASEGIRTVVRASTA